MQLLPRLADALDQRILHHHMNIFQRLIKLKFPRLDIALDALEPLNNFVSLAVVNQPHFGQHRRMRNRPRDILLIHPPVIGDRFDERLGQFVGGFADPRLPGLLFGHSRDCRPVGGLRKIAVPPHTLAG